MALAQCVSGLTSSLTTRAFWPPGRTAVRLCCYGNGDVSVNDVIAGQEGSCGARLKNKSIFLENKKNINS